MEQGEEQGSKESVENLWRGGDPRVGKKPLARLRLAAKRIISLHEAVCLVRAWC